MQQVLIAAHLLLLQLWNQYPRHYQIHTKNMEEHGGAVLADTGGGGLTHPSLGGRSGLEVKLGRERSRVGEEAWAGEKQGGETGTPVAKPRQKISSPMSVVVAE
jgi:hypothetical protein